MDILAAMNPNAEQAPPEGPKGRTWLETLPAKAKRNAASALAALPVDAASAAAELPLAIAAWALADPEMAGRLIEAWLATADGEGNLSPSCPVVCQLAEQVAETHPEPEVFVERILPVLARCVERELDRYDARGTGLPLWGSAAEALFPAEFAPGRFTVDLAVLLSNEASALDRLAKGNDRFGRALDAAESEQRELDNWLKDSFWNEEASAFHRYDAGGENVPDPSPCGFFPLIWEGRTETMSEGLRSRAAEMAPLAWPARTWALFFALLLRTPHNSVVARMHRAGLPAGATAVEQAAWTVLTLGAEAVRSPYAEGIPPAVRWLDAHGRAIVRGSLVCGGLLLISLLGWAFFHREMPGAGDGAELERKARLACEEGEHARAAAVYGQALRRGDATYFRYRQAGEWMHLERFADAEAAYREILAREPGTPNTRLNLALAVWKQGRREEALELYRAFAEDPAASAHPELAARARLAAELIGRQVALDRE